jgi:L-arabinose isomerase
MLSFWRRETVPVDNLSRGELAAPTLAPGPAIDYEAFNRMGDRTKMTGEWLSYCQPCSVPEIANVFNRCRIPFFQVSGMLENDPVAWSEIEQWIEAARVAQVMEHNRLGVMGNYYGGMLDIYSDLTQAVCLFRRPRRSHRSRGIGGTAQRRARI